ncbi:toll-like receptor 3 [Branchiostoma floridae]|uniref:Toll-like receptor 3 n=1 Tax=Branchiostoma floridae TaxID=7739 RepID=A0A9J7M6M8_BRAFL|nr:toll-like receptor 3 [Branchiostoma floridae]
MTIPQDIPPNATVLDLSYNCIPVLKNSSLAFLSHLKHLNISYSCVHDIQIGAFHNVSHLKVLNLEHNSLTVLQKFSFSALHSLEKLLLSHNNITNIDPESFHNLTNLQCLDLSHNKLDIACTHLKMFQDLQHLECLDMSFTGDIWGSSKSNCSQTLQNLTNLVSLKLSSCGIGNIPANALENQKNLQYLDLSFNDLHSLPNDIFFTCNSTNLNVNLRGNHIGSLSAQVFSTLHPALELDLSGNDFFQIGSSTLMAIQNVSLINLSDNPFDCDCELVDFVQWANNHEAQVAGWNNTTAVIDHYKCANEKYEGKSLEDYSEYCPSTFSWSLNHIAIIASSVSAFVILIIIVLMVIYKRYRKHEPERQGYAPIIGFQDLQQQDYHYLYDLFIIHSREDIRWVQMCAARLEKGEYTVSYMERDLPGGCHSLEGIDHFINNSRIILGIITMNSLCNGLCRHALQIARQLEIEQGAHHQLKLIMLEDIDLMMNNLAPEDRGRVFSIIRGKPYIRWPEDGREERQFWDRLEQMIGNPVV